MPGTSTAEFCCPSRDNAVAYVAAVALTAGTGAGAERCINASRCWDDLCTPFDWGSIGGPLLSAPGSGCPRSFSTCAGRLHGQGPQRTGHIRTDVTPGSAIRQNYRTLLTCELSLSGCPLKWELYRHRKVYCRNIVYEGAGRGRARRTARTRRTARSGSGGLLTSLMPSTPVMASIRALSPPRISCSLM